MKRHPILMVLFAFACLAGVLGLTYFLFTNVLESFYSLLAIFLIGILISNIVAKTLAVLFDRLNGN